MVKICLFVNLCKSREIKTKGIDDVVLLFDMKPVLPLLLQRTHLFVPLPISFGDPQHFSIQLFVLQQ